MSATDLNPSQLVAFEVMKMLTDDERASIMCWFCRGCYRYVGPGDNCYCQDDE